MILKLFIETISNESQSIIEVENFFCNFKIFLKKLQFSLGWTGDADFFHSNVQQIFKILVFHYKPNKLVHLKFNNFIYNFKNGLPYEVEN